MIQRAPPHLLGRHVAQRSHHDARLRVLRLRRRARFVAGLLVLGPLRQTEVEDLQVAVFRDEEVFGLQVSVDDPLLVRRGEAFGDLEGEVHGLLRRDGPRVEPVAQRHALEELHHEKVTGRRGRRAGDFFEGEDGGNVGVAQRGERFRFPFEPGLALFTFQEILGQDLDRDIPREARVSRPIDLTHSAGPQRSENLVGAEPRAGRERHSVRRFYARAAGRRSSRFRPGRVLRTSRTPRRRAARTLRRP